MRTLRIASLVALALIAIAGCGHQKAVIPVDSPLVQWSPPEDLQPAPAGGEAPAPKQAKPEAAKPSGK